MKRTTLLNFLILVFIICSPFCFAADEQGPSVLFYKGNMAYEQGKFDEAIKEYQSALAAGLESGNIYYNLANAHFKKGELGLAILNYKRAQRFIPQDPDLRANLEYAQSVVEQQVGQKMNLLTRLIKNIIKDLNIDGLAVFLVSLYLAIFLLAVLLLFVKDIGRLIKIPLVVCCLLFIIVIIGFFVKIDQLSQPWAIILGKGVEARYEPFDSATVHFKLFQGQEALLVKQKGDWAFIKRPDGKAGWIKASSVEKI